MRHMMIVFHCERPRLSRVQAMPCCVRAGLYSVTTRHVSDDARHAAMVGMVAGAYGAHLIVSVDRRITNRNLLVMGGYEPIEAVCHAAESDADGVHAVGHDSSERRPAGTRSHEERVRDWHGREPGRRREAERAAGR